METHLQPWPLPRLCQSPGSGGRKLLWRPAGKPGGQCLKRVAAQKLEALWQVQGPHYGPAGLQLKPERQAEECVQCGSPAGQAQLTVQEGRPPSGVPWGLCLGLQPS